MNVQMKLNFSEHCVHGTWKQKVFGNISERFRLEDISSAL